MSNKSALKRGFHYDYANSRLSIYADGEEVARLDPTYGLIPVVNGFDLAGQTITTVNASGSADYSTMIAAYNGGDATADEGAKYAILITVGGVDAYIPAFTSV